MNAVLGVVLVLLVAAAVFVLVQRPGGDPGSAAAESLSHEYAAVTAAARRETAAFLTVDYKNMEPTVRTVLAGATGQFKKEYQKAEVNLRAAAHQSKATSTGKVRAVGIGDIDSDSAIVYVAADSTVSNESTGHKKEPRYYRFQLNMTLVKGKWLTSDLHFVS
ncbi:MAG TPA: hypothetical protein VFL69_12845 [Marmoricola sp.]|nr:hypothetical protein [Marmoricola sp.]